MRISRIHGLVAPGNWGLFVLGLSHGSHGTLRPSSLPTTRALRPIALPALFHKGAYNLAKRLSDASFLKEQEFRFMRQL